MDADFLKLSGKVALVVGGGQGIGEATARYLARAGCDVAVVDLEPARGQAVAGEIASLGRRSIFLKADILDDDALPRVVDEVVSRLGGLDIVAAIVGQAKFGSVLELTHDEWDRDHRRNLRYFFFLVQAAARSFIRRKVPGSIVGLATAGVTNSMPFRSGYGAAKAGLAHLVRTAAVELGEYGIRINCVAPGLVVTPRTEGRITADSAAEIAERIPLRKLGRPDDIAKAVLFLASDLAGHVTGTALAMSNARKSSNSRLLTPRLNTSLPNPPHSPSPVPPMRARSRAT